MWLSLNKQITLLHHFIPYLKMDKAKDRCTNCGSTSTRGKEYKNLREELKERKKKMKRELEKLEMDLASLEEVDMKSKNAIRLYNSCADELGKALVETEDEGCSDVDNVEELQMKLQNAAILYNSGLDELDEAMSKIKGRLGGEDVGVSK